MRTFSSYGPIDKDNHYYAPRTEVLNYTWRQLIGEDPDKGGHYITVWAPRQSGKTWVMQQVVARLQAEGAFEVGLLNLQSTRGETQIERVWEIFDRELSVWFGRQFPPIQKWQDLYTLFSEQNFSKPLILILDEFDSLEETFINHFANEFRSMFTSRSNQMGKKSSEKGCLLHGLALVGVRSVIGVENERGSPFNIQRSVHIPNLTHIEVTGMFDWYRRESGQEIESAVVDRVFYETRGQPGLTSWLGELLTERYNKHNTTITTADFEAAYAAAVDALPNNNILNIISKAKQEPHKSLVLELFQTGEKLPFHFYEPRTNYLYMHGVVDYELVAETRRYLRFASPLVQKWLFYTFSAELFGETHRLYAPFVDLADTITPTTLHMRNLLVHYQRYLHENSERLFQDAPRRSTDLRVFEAVYHFNLFTYLARFLDSYGGRVTPEFPTGNGQIDLLIQHAGQRFGLEVKSFMSQHEYTKALYQAARYAQQLGLHVITLLLFVEAVDDENRRKYEAVYQDAATGVTVEPVFVTTGP